MTQTVTIASFTRQILSVFSRPYSNVSAIGTVLCLYVVSRRLSVCTECIVAKRCVLAQRTNTNTRRTLQAVSNLTGFRVAFVTNEQVIVSAARTSNGVHAITARARRLQLATCLCSSGISSNSRLLNGRQTTIRQLLVADILVVYRVIQAQRSATFSCIVVYVIERCRCNW